MTDQPIPQPIPETAQEAPERLSHYLQVTNNKGETFNIPVIDVRDGVVERGVANFMVKSSNRSKYMNYNQYNYSAKKTKTI